MLNNRTSGSYDGTFAFGFARDQRLALLALGRTEADLTDLETKVTTRYHDLNGVYGAGGNYDTVNDAEDGSDDYDPLVYDPNFQFELTAAQTADLTAGVVFQPGDLLWTLSADVVRPSSDTTTRIERPNISGHEINVTVSGAFGRPTGQVLSIPVPSGDLLQIDDDEDNNLKIALLSAETEDLAFLM